MNPNTTASSARRGAALAGAMLCAAAAGAGCVSHTTTRPALTPGTGEVVSHYEAVASPDGKSMHWKAAPPQGERANKIKPDPAATGWNSAPHNPTYTSPKLQSSESLGQQPPATHAPASGATVMPPLENISLPK